VELKELQQTVDDWILGIGGYWDKFQILARLTEELGEVSGALQRQEGLRPREVEIDLEDEVGDLLFTVAAFANVMNIDLEQSVAHVMQKYKIRDAQAWKDNLESQDRR
jgi:NTP pyrophosphatase (non-canonical NTP hydrolase)